MPGVRGTQAPFIPPEYRLATVSEQTVAQHEDETPPFETALRDFTDSNPQLVLWLRLEATRLFPDDLANRKAAVGLALGALSLVQSQQLLDALMQRFGDGTNAPTQ